MSEVVKLAGVELKRLFGVNIFVHTRDRAARRRYAILLAAWILVGAVVVFYVGALAFGLHTLGLGELILPYLVMISSLMILGFGIFKAGAIIFAPYELLAAMPVRKGSIVAARFVYMYVSDLVLTLAVMLPGAAVYGFLARPGVGFYLTALVGTAFVPMLPLVISTVFGTIVSALAAGMRHKSIAQAAFAVVLVVAILVLMSNPALAEVTEEQLGELVAGFGAVISRIWPPASWLTGGIGGILTFVGVSVAALAAMLVVVTALFEPTVRRLQTTSATHDYRLGTQLGRSMLSALVMREMRRYFASSVYVMNTIIGPIMGLVLAVAVLVAGATAVVGEIPGEVDVNALAPFVLAAVASMMTPAACSISMEGRGFELTRSLPIPTGTLVASKVLFSFLLGLPFTLAAEILLAIALKPSLPELAMLLVIPPAMGGFAALLGVAVDLRLCRFDWEREEQVVKQGASAMLGGFGGALVTLICGAVVYLSPLESAVTAALELAALAGVAALLRRRCARVELSRL